MPQTQSGHPCPTGGRRSGTRRGHIGQYRSALLHWVQVPGKASSKNNTVKIQEEPRQACKKQTIAPVAGNFSSSCTDIIRGYRGDATRVRQHVARVITEQLERHGQGGPQTGQRPGEKGWTINKNEEIQKHHVRDYKKRRCDRNSNMQPVTCSSSDTAMETATNPQADTSYSRRQRPYQGENPGRSHDLGHVVGQNCGELEDTGILKKYQPPGNT